MMRKIFGAWGKFFLPGFHPWNEDDRALIADYDAVAPMAEPAKKVRRATSGLTFVIGEIMPPVARPPRPRPGHPPAPAGTAVSSPRRRGRSCSAGR